MLRSCIEKLLGGDSSVEVEVEFAKTACVCVCVAFITKVRFFSSLWRKIKSRARPSSKTKVSPLVFSSSKLILRSCALRM